MKPIIYFIEDDESINTLINETLLKNDFEPYGFLEPLSFLKRIEQRKPDLIILDLMLPVMSGFEVLRRLKKDPEYDQIPVIILSAKSLETDIVRGLDMGASDYITKPFGLLEFISRINVNLRKVNMHKGKILKVKDLTLDTLKHKLFYLDKEIELRNKEYDIMEELMATPSIVVTRKQLFKNIWGFDYDVETRTLDMHIKTLREKLFNATGETYIITIRGVGYIINE